jgi:glucose/mannose-6-phosphate isomerase
MAGFLEGFPRQLDDAAQIGGKAAFLRGMGRDFDKIVFAGIGGSAIGADLIRSYAADECVVPIIVNRDYTLPAFVNRKTLLFVSSYSGNTEETLSAYVDGRDKKATIVAVTTNGELIKRAQKDSVPCIVVPQGYPPRSALGYMSIPVLVFLSKMGFISDKEKDIKEASGLLTKMRDTMLSVDVSDDKNIAKRIAKDLVGKYAIIYGASQRTDCVAARWRGQIAENSKTLSSSHLFPEMNHNEVAGWMNPKNLLKDIVALILRDRQDHPRVAKRMDITMSIIKKEGVRVLEVPSMGQSLLARLFSLIYIGDFVSLYLAVLNGVDPTPVDNITYLKEELANESRRTKDEGRGTK